MIRATAMTACALLVAACAGVEPSFDAQPAVRCGEMIGPGWTFLPGPPDNAAELRGLVNSWTTDEGRILWLGRPDGSRAVCFYARNACEAGAYVFRKRGETWFNDDNAVWERICTG